MKKYCMDIVALVSLLLIVGLVVWNHQVNKNVCVAAPLAVSADVAGQPPVIDPSVLDKVVAPVTGGAAGSSGVQAPAGDPSAADNVAAPLTGESLNAPVETPSSGVQVPSVAVPEADKVAAPLTGGSLNAPVESPAADVQSPATGAVSDTLTNKPQVAAPSSLTAPIEDKVDSISEGAPEEESSLPGAAPATGDK